MLSHIQQQLADHPWRNDIHYFETIDSTNTYAKQLATAGAPEGTIVIAEHQTGGRGRLGRSFSSPAGMGIYMSLILRPDCLPEELMHLTCATGVAATQAVEEAHGAKPGIKWTNDLVLGRQKLGGILTEISVDPCTRKVAWAVIGIGINCCQQSKEAFAPEIREIACSLDMPWEDTPALFAALIRQLHHMRCGLFDKQEEIMHAFRSKCVTLGKDISILRGDAVRHGKAISVDDSGGLWVEYPDGSTESVASGEVSIRGMYGYL